MSFAPETAAAPGRTVADVAAAARCSPDDARLLLGQLERAGTAERVGDLWRLTATAEAAYGPALREMRIE